VSTAERYDELWRHVYGDMQSVGPAHRHLRRLERKLLAAIDYSSVLDVGCGAGHNLQLLTHGRELERVSGIDMSEQALARARQRGGGEFTRLDIETDELPDRWDLVFSSLVLEHLVDDLAALRHMRAMTRRHLLVASVAGDFQRYRSWEQQVGHVRNYGPGELEDKLEAAGFRVRRAVYWGFPFYSPLARRLQNRMTAEPSYSRSTRLLAELMHALYFLNSHRRGDLVIVHAGV
jgi:SAM-dependent methyltransferase